MTSYSTWKKPFILWSRHVDQSFQHVTINVLLCKWFIYCQLGGISRKVSWIKSFKCWFQVVPDHRFRKEIMQLEVYCFNKANGCSHRGKWNKLQVDKTFYLEERLSRIWLLYTHLLGIDIKVQKTARLLRLLCLIDAWVF